MGEEEKSGKKSGISRRKALVLGLAALVVAGGGIAAFWFFGSNAADQPGQTEDVLNSNKFYDGVFVDDIPLGGLTMPEARQQVEARQKAFADSTGVTVTGGGQSWQFKISDAAYTFDTDSILSQAWQQGRQGTARERRAYIKKLASSPVRLKTTVTVDPSPLEQKVRALAAPFAVAPVDASFAGYDPTKPDGQRLSFTEDIAGSRVDDDQLWDDVRMEFVNRTYGTVQMKAIPVPANLKLADVQANMQLVARFKSTMKDHSTPRYTNIKLASAAISGRFVLPGETFSFNDATGERTAAKGYQVAHIINAGVTDNGLAGGTCQVSGTLFNAVARADLKIVERTAHTLRSAYLPLGQDATVDYGHYDLKFMNDKSTPILLVMYIGSGADQYNVFAEIYGTPLPNGESINLLTVKTDTVPAPNTVTYTPSNAVKPGTTETVKPHDGVKATTYKLYMQAGKEISRVILHKDYYKEAGTIICYNPADGLPTPTPLLTPTPAWPWEPLPPEATP